MTTENEWRLISYKTRSGGENMAIDFMLAQTEHSTPILRFYGWQPYAISLGYHQKADWLDLTRVQENGFDLVRRPTGGRAILHGEELTYSVILPTTISLAHENTQTIHNRISRGLAAGLRQLGLPAELRKVSTDLRRHYRKDRTSATCFSSTTKHEIQIHGKKVVGSAQRKFQHAVLQHGSMLIGPAHRQIAEFTMGSKTFRGRMAKILREKTTELESCTDDQIPPEELAGSITNGFRSELGCVFHLREILPAELEESRRYLQKFTCAPGYEPPSAVSV